MWGSLNLQGLILISSEKLLLAWSDKDVFRLILPSPLCCPSQAIWSYLSGGIRWAISAACIHYLKYLPNRLQEGKWCDSIFWNFLLFGGELTQILATSWLFCPVQQYVQCSKVMKAELLHCLAALCCLFPFTDAEHHVLIFLETVDMGMFFLVFI